jgi:cobalt-zinc-cadmium efflux system membrane fusion protein
MRRALSWMVLLGLAGCHTHEEAAEHGHGHGDEGHGHGHDHGHEDEGPEPVAVTRWTATHELFVEFDPPVVGQSVQYHAHVTRLADNRAATEGTLDVAWLRGDEAVASFVALEVARPGIFAFPAPAPDAPGEYALRFTYRHGDEEAVWDAGRFAVGAEPAPPPETPEGEISFLKEAQWRIPFAIATPTRRAIARSVRLVAVVEPAPGQLETVGSPAAGRLRWDAEAALAVGTRVAAGQVVARVYPAATDANWSTLRLRVRESEVERQRASAEVERLRGLVRDGLVPGRRLDEAEAALAQARARLDAAREQRDQTRGAQPTGIEVRAPGDGVVVELAATDGAPVAPGAPLLRLVAEGRLRLRAEVLPAELPGGPGDVRGAWLEPRGGERVEVPRDGLATSRLVADQKSGLAPLVFAAPPGAWGLGAQVPLRLTVGPPTEALTVPRAAVVEINTQPFVFVMVGGESFTRRRVRLGPGDATHVAVLAGVGPADRVVTVGGFDVYVASLSGSLESHRH